MTATVPLVGTFPGNRTLALSLSAMQFGPAVSRLAVFLCFCFCRCADCHGCPRYPFGISWLHLLPNFTAMPTFRQLVVFALGELVPHAPCRLSSSSFRQWSHSLGPREWRESLLTFCPPLAKRRFMEPSRRDATPWILDFTFSNTAGGHQTRELRLSLKSFDKNRARWAGLDRVFTCKG